MTVRLGDHVGGGLRAYFPDDVEKLREDVAKYGMQGSAAAAKVMRARKVAADLAALVEELRAEGNYQVSDRLRALSSALKDAVE